MDLCTLRMCGRHLRVSGTGCHCELFGLAILQCISTLHNKLARRRRSMKLHTLQIYAHTQCRRPLPPCRYGDHSRAVGVLVVTFIQFVGPDGGSGGVRAGGQIRRHNGFH